jgi:hypothetical protein
MTSVQSSIRAEVKRGEFPAPKGAEAFAAYAIAHGKGLIPEMESAARQTLEHSMTLEILGEGLRFFEGSSLRELARFRERVRENLIACLNLFLDVQPSGPSSNWVGCPEVMRTRQADRSNRILPKWLSQNFLQHQINRQLRKFTFPLDINSRIRQAYLTALQNPMNCLFCSGVHIKSGSTFCTELENKLVQAQDKVFYRISLAFKYHET